MGRGAPPVRKPSRRWFTSSASGPRASLPSASRRSDVDVAERSASGPRASLPASPSGGVVVVAGTILCDDTGVSRHRGSGPMPSEASIHQGPSEHRPVRGHPCPHLNQVSARPSEASMHQGRSEHRPVRGHPCPAPRAVRVSARKSEASPYQTHGFGAHAKSGCLVGRQSAFVARCVCLVIATP